MLFSLLNDLTKRSEAQILAIPFWEKPRPAAPISKSLEEVLKYPLSVKDFEGKEREFLFHYVQGQKEQRLLLFGLGREEELNLEKVRRAYGALAKFCHKKKLTKVNFLLPNVVELRNFSLEECLKAVSVGVLSVNYSWDQKSKENKVSLLDNIELIGAVEKYSSHVKNMEEVFEAVYFARDLINGNADIVTPQYLSQASKKLSEKFPQIETTIFDKKRIEKEKMGLLLAVGQGSRFDPAFIIANYRGNPRSKDHTVIIGKGVTFDTGGLNLKPTGSMETMKSDMSGAAAVLGTIAAVAALKLKVNVTSVIPTCENAIGSKSFKPGDVYVGYSGKSVEIGNTDAEGRLILADALAYSVKNLKPSRVINLATLTGAVRIALGEDMAGLFSNDDQLAEALLLSGEATGENLWRLPLHQDYKEKLKSDIADLKNVGGRPAGAILGSLFLEAFVDNIPWAHLDIGGVAFMENEKAYLPKNGVGFGIRLLVDYLAKL